MLWISARSCAMWCSLPEATASPAMPITKVLPRCMWMYGATERNHGTKVKLKMADIGSGRGRAKGRDSVRERPLAFVIVWGYGRIGGGLLGRILRHCGADARAFAG